MWMRHLALGEISVYSLTDGRFRLDGGAMFGIVPKTIWSKLTPADELNRIPLRINPLLMCYGRRRILVETGICSGDAQFAARYALERDETVFSGLAELGLTVQDIDTVIHTHLHFDHAGRNTTNGKPTFPNAQHIVQRSEWLEASQPHERNRASYLPELWEPLMASNQLTFVDGALEWLPNIWLKPAPGHNLGQQIVEIRGGGQTLVYTADLLPTLAHAPYAYTLGYDLYPVTCVEQRKLYFPQWHAEQAILATPHDPNHPFGRLQAHPKGGFIGVPYTEV